MKRTTKVIATISNEIAAELKSVRGLNYRDRVDIARRICKRFKTVKSFDFIESAPAAGHVGGVTHLKDRVRINLKSGQGRYNYAPVVEIYFA